MRNIFLVTKTILLPTVLFNQIVRLIVGVSVSSGNNEPAHYKLKIELFSLLIEAGIVKYESDVFEAGGYKWSVSKKPIFYVSNRVSLNDVDIISDVIYFAKCNIALFFSFSNYYVLMYI